MTEFLLMVSGEGPTDMGNQYGGQLQPGPMLKMIQIYLRDKHVISCSDDHVKLVRKQAITEKSQSLRKDNKRLFHFGRKWPRGYSDFRANAYVLGILAIEDNASIAVFFRDCDRSRSTPMDEWDYRIKSIENGFAHAGYDRGVAMAPKPVSEAWLLALLCEPQQAPQLENLPGNDSSNKHPKKILAKEHQISDRNAMINLLERKYKAGAINMDSYKYFEKKLDGAIACWRQMLT